MQRITSVNKVAGSQGFSNHTPSENDKASGWIFR
jgi:hypothetical protein